MRSSRIWSPLCRTLLLALAVALAPHAADAQAPGRITGTVVGQEGGPIYGAQVSVVGTRIGALSDVNGQFVLTGVPAGPQQLRVSYLGYRDETAALQVRAGEATNVEVQLQRRPVELGGVVVSAARREQRVTEAPATITRIGPEVLDNSVGNNFASALKQAVGLDYIQVGMTSVAINARGFNSSFNNRMLMLEDGRIAVLPESGLPIGAFTTMPKVDLAGIEVLVGPGAALYGADASNGVLTLLSKDPRQYPGTTIEVTGGSREYRNIQARQAGLFGDWGYKFTGEFQSANDWENELCYTAACLPEVGVGGGVNWKSQVARGQGSIVRYFGDSRFEVSGGASQTDGVGQTNVGRNQFDGWTYNFLQARLSTPRWYAQLYRTQSRAGDSYAINRFTENRANPAHADKTDEQIRLMSDWPSDGRLYAAEIQNNFRLPALLNTSFVWGAQYRQDLVSSDRQWLTDRLTDKDVDISQYGLYAQAETPITDWLNLILAGRFDDHKNYEAQFSPKAGVVVKPTPDQAVRLTFNRAFKSPTILQTNFHIPDWNAVTAIFGNTRGYTIRLEDGTAHATYDPLVPEQNQTWEVGYKGVLGNRLFQDVAGYHSRYENFFSPLVIVADPLGLGLAGLPAGTPSFAYDADGQLITNPAGISPLTLIYYNLGKATIYGMDAGVNYFLTPAISLRGSLSLLEVENIEVPANRAEATAINSPATKWTLGANFSEFGHILDGNFFGGLTARHVNSYYFRSGINIGVIPTFTTLDLNAGYRIPRWNTTVNLGVNNLFSCSQNEDEPFTYAAEDVARTTPLNKDRKCGFGMKHQEMINMPSIGTMVFIGARYHIN